MKKILYTLSLIISILFIDSCEEDNVPLHGCLDSQACNYNSEATIDNNSCEYAEEGYDCGEIYIGLETEGGIIFYIDESGEHGLVAAKENLVDGYEWGCYEISVNGADGDEIGAGYQNTLDILYNGCESYYGGVIAAEAASNIDINGFSDWFLPSTNELLEIYNTIGRGGNLGNPLGLNGSYWSSERGPLCCARVVSLNNGMVYYTSQRRFQNPIAVIRAF